MSEYLTVQAVYKDEALLRQAIEAVCAEQHIPPELHLAGQEQHLIGFIGDTRPETAQFIIRRRHLSRSGASNDLGWSRQPDGTYRLVISEFDQGDERTNGIAGAVDVEYQRLFVERQIRSNPKLRGGRVVANRDVRTGAVQIQIQNVRV